MRHWLSLIRHVWDKGIPAWPGYDCVVYADTTAPSVYLAWQKGQAFMPIIIGILVTVVVPAFTGRPGLVAAAAKCEKHDHRDH